MTPRTDPFAPPALRRSRQPIADSQVTLGFPESVARQCRWHFEDGTFSLWRTAGPLLTAPPAARACEWRAKPQD